jgi:hypothetical protein
VRAKGDEQVRIALIFVPIAAVRILSAAGHGPVFGLATPTNPKGGWSLDLGVNGRDGTGGGSATAEAEPSYGLTQNLKLSASAPVVLGADPYPRSPITSSTPVGGDFSGQAWWRFHRRDLAGKRIESTALAGVLLPGPQEEAGAYRGLHSGLGYVVGAVTGVASRSQYIWAGASYSRYAESNGDRRPDLLFYSVVYGYRPKSWRTDYPRWDWRIFGELSGERAGSLRRGSADLPGSGARQVFLGPSVLGVYRNIGVEGGIQFPVYRDAGPFYPRERFRFALNFAYFF